jgi:predicted dehydrogenase
MSTLLESGLRFAILGCGASIVPTHLAALAALPNTQLVGMSDIDGERGAKRATEANCRFFADHRVLLAELRPDVVVICTPHPFHTDLTLDALAAGAHVLVEKPMAVEVAEADQMIAAAEAAGRILAVNFQQRFLPAVEHARTLVDSGALGSLVRVSCVEPWFRTEAYYRSASWRATWKGEGGGVLLNQAPHTIDLLCHLAGMPTKLWGWTRTLQHAIECEDSAQAMLEFANGAPGYLHISTVEAGIQRRLQIVGDRAALELIGDALSVYRYDTPLREFSLTSPEMFGAPQVYAEEIVFPNGNGGEGHVAVYRDLQRAILEGDRPRADGREARMSLELANAMIFSSHTGQAVNLPLDRAAYSALLADLRAGQGISSSAINPAENRSH